MKRFLFAALCALLLVVPAASAKKAHAKAFPTSLSLVSQTSTTATFGVAITGSLPPRGMGLWVANICSDAAGVTVTAQYLAVQSNGSAGPFATNGTSPFAGVIVTCSAYVWDFPDAWTPISNTVTYSP